MSGYWDDNCGGPDHFSSPKLDVHVQTSKASQGVDLAICQRIALPCKSSVMYGTVASSLDFQQPPSAHEHRVIDHYALEAKVNENVIGPA